MFGLARVREVAEHEAEGEIERVYHEIRQTLRVTGVDSFFRSLAPYTGFLPAAWDAIRPNAETLAFERAGDQIREAAVREAERFGTLQVLAGVPLGESQSYQLRAALDLYHYINPKVLILAAGLEMALAGEFIGRRSDGLSERIEKGQPAGMHCMEMVPVDSADKQVRRAFDEIRKALSLETISSEYRTLALWPDYLTAVWNRLKPAVQSAEYRRAGERLRERARSLANTLPYPIPITRGRAEELEGDAGNIVRITELFSRSLPGLILNVALISLDWRSADTLAQSPFPPALRHPEPAI